MPPVGIVEEFDVVEHRAVRVRPRSPGPVVIELGEQRICTDADGFAAVAAAPGAASVRVWTIMSRGRGPRGGPPLPEGVDVDYPLAACSSPSAVGSLVPRLLPSRTCEPIDDALTIRALISRRFDGWVSAKCCLVAVVGPPRRWRPHPSNPLMRRRVPLAPHEREYKADGTSRDRPHCHRPAVIGTDLTSRGRDQVAT